MSKISLNDVIKNINKILFNEDPTDFLSDKIIDKANELINAENISNVDKSTSSDFYNILATLIYKENAVEKINKQKINNKDVEEIAKSLMDETTIESAISSKEYNTRIARYDQYTFMKKEIGRLKRAINVFTSNILSPDYVSKDIGDFKFEENLIIDDNVLEQLRFLDKHIVKLDTNADEIVRKTLSFGDCFVEILNIKDDIERKKQVLMLSDNVENVNNNPIMESIVKESMEFEKLGVKVNFIFEGLTKDKYSLIEDMEIYNMVMEAKSKHSFDDMSDEQPPDLKITTAEQDKEEIIELLKDTKEEILDTVKKFEEDNKIKDKIHLYKIKIHHPKQVIRLGNENVCFGYLVFPKEYVDQGNIVLTPIELLKQGKLDYDKNNTATHDSIIEEFSKKLYDKFFNLLKEYYDDLIDELSVSELSALNDLMELFAKYVVAKNSLGVDSLKLKVKYIPPSKMVHFRIDVDDFSPYGTSILHSILLDAKMLIATKVANAIDMIANSRDQLIVNFDIDYTNDVRDYLEQIKRKLKQAKFLFNDNMSIDAIPSVISNFEAFYIPRREDKRYIDMEYLTKKDTSNNPELLKYQRDETISGLDIPPPYLGIEENIESKATLSFENVIFASVVLNKQKQFNNYFTELFYKLYYQVYGDYPYNVEFNLRPPLLLIVNSIVDLINNFTTTYDFLINTLQIDVRDVVSEFMPYLSKFFTNEKNMDKLLNEVEKRLSGGGENANQGLGGL